MRCFIGLMSGTSVDAVDGALVEIEQHPAVLRTAAFASRPIRPALRSELEAMFAPKEQARAA